MSERLKFYICKHCGNIVEKIKDSKVDIVCCGETMSELVPNTEDASQEKHVPVITKQNSVVTVQIGSVLHPMIEEHHIEWIYLETKKGGQRKSLVVGEKPEAIFLLEDDEAVAAYEYCNIHGLWKAEIN